MGGGASAPPSPSAPTLVADADGGAVPGFGSLTFQLLGNGVPLTGSLDSHSPGAHAGAERERDGDDPRRETNQELLPEILTILDFLAAEALRQLVASHDIEADPPQDVPSASDDQLGP